MHSHIARLIDDSHLDSLSALSNISDDRTSSPAKRIHHHLIAYRLDKRPSAVVYVGSKFAGHLVRSDIVSFRLKDVCEIDSILDTADPGSYIPAMAATSERDNDVKVLISTAIGVIVVQGSDETDLAARLARTYTHMDDKLDLPLTTETAMVTRRICLVGGGFSLSFRLGTLQAARAVGIQLVVVDQPGHWMESHQDLCEAFIPIDMKIDEGFSTRLTLACQKYGMKLDGITTLADDYRVVTAEVAQSLCLQTDSPEIFDTCTKKDKFRQIFPIENCPSFCATTIEDFRAQVNNLVPHLPLIVKPQSGANSVGVNKAESLDELEHLVSGLVQSGSPALIEKYISGPEVDVDVVLIDGSVVFCDINDGVPCSAEPSGQLGAPASFIETTLYWPSILPLSEQTTLREAALGALKKLGFKNGVFHLEARIADSAMEWQPSDGSQPPRLQPTSQDGNAKMPWAMLIELNPRTIGYPGAAAISSCYGIDYALLQLVLCVGDLPLARILAKPFQNLGKTCVVTEFIPTPHRGTFYGQAMFEVLMHQRPDLMEKVVEKIVFFEDGRLVRDPKERASWITFYIVKSDRGREDAMRISEEIKSTVIWEVRGMEVDKQL